MIHPLVLIIFILLAAALLSLAFYVLEVEPRSLEGGKPLPPNFNYNGTCGRLVDHEGQCRLSDEVLPGRECGKLVDWR